MSWKARSEHLSAQTLSHVGIAARLGNAVHGQDDFEGRSVELRATRD
jgi:hypothetical protein